MAGVKIEDECGAGVKIAAKASTRAGAMRRSVETDRSAGECGGNTESSIQDPATSILVFVNYGIPFSLPLRSQP